MRSIKKIASLAALCVLVPAGALFADYHYDSVYSSLDMDGGSRWSSGSAAAPTGAEVYYEIYAYAYGGTSASANVTASGAAYVSDSVSSWDSSNGSVFLSSPGTVYYSISANTSGDAWGEGSAYASAMFVVAW